VYGKSVVVEIKAVKPSNKRARASLSENVNLLTKRRTVAISHCTLDFKIYDWCVCEKKCFPSSLLGTGGI
jgi:hypothetical protein